MDVRKQVIDGYLRHGFTRAEAERTFDRAAHHASQAAVAATVTLEVNCPNVTPRDRAVHLLALQLAAALLEQTACNMADDLKAQGGIIANFEEVPDAR